MLNMSSEDSSQEGPAQTTTGAKVVLLVAALVTALLEHLVDTGVIIGVVVINGLIGFIQEGRAEAAIAARHRNRWW